MKETKTKIIKVEIEIPEDFDARMFINELADEYFYANRSDEEMAKYLEHIHFRLISE